MKKLISINPANQKVLGEIPISTDQDIAEKVKLAHDIKEKWKSLGVKKRVEILRPLIALFKEKESDIAELITLEMGKKREESLNEVNFSFDYLAHFLNEGPSYIADEVTVKQDNMTHRIVFEPRGVVACISPWNYPLNNFIWAIIPNLIVGNTVVFKHSEECPLFGKLMEEIMLKLPHLPTGVFSEIYGDGKVGEILINQNVDLIWFTGSSPVGKKLFQLAGEKSVKAILEMGGSNPAIIFDDIDIEEIIPKIYRGRFSNCGQSCDAIKRLIVHKNIFQSVVEKLKKQIESIQVGDPQLASTDLGPLVAMRQVTLLDAQVKDAIQQGAQAIIGAPPPQTEVGAYYSPTLLVNIKNSMRVWKEEVFGPVLPIVSFETEEQAIALANDTCFGLGANVYSKNLARAERIALKIEAGSININEGCRWIPCNPFSGYKTSGMGCTHGRLGFQELCQPKLIAQA